MSPTPKVDIEYCGKCNFKSQCHELQQRIRADCPQAIVTCREGRRGSFEVRIDGTLVHSKLASVAFPSFDDVAVNVVNAHDGRPVQPVAEQPITDCVIQ